MCAGLSTTPICAGRTLYIEGERKLDFLGWSTAIQLAAGSSGDTLSQQQLTESDIPVIVDRCIHYITQYGKKLWARLNAWLRMLLPWFFFWHFSQGVNCVLSSYSNSKNNFMNVAEDMGVIPCWLIIACVFLLFSFFAPNKWPQTAANEDILLLIRSERGKKLWKRKFDHAIWIFFCAGPNLSHVIRGMTWNGVWRNISKVCWHLASNETIFQQQGSYVRSSCDSCLCSGTSATRSAEQRTLILCWN